MSDSTTILQTARERGEDDDLPYCGTVTPAEAWYLFQHQPGVKIIDVRTRPEWQFVGIVPDAELIEWESYPHKQRNPNFLAQLRAKADPEGIVLFLCRSTRRAHEAAAFAAANGYAQVYTILEGFDGKPDANQQRGRRWGWKAAGLPWINV